MTAEVTRFVRTYVKIAKETGVGRPSPVLARVEGGFANWMMISIHCVGEREGETFRSVVDKLKVMGPVPSELGLDRSELSHLPTVCKATDRLTTTIFRRLLRE